MAGNRVVRRGLWLAVVGLIVLAAWPDRRQPGAAETQEATSAFDTADQQFRSLYAEGREATLNAFGPVIIVEMDDLILLRDGKRTQVPVIPPLYHHLKAVSHIPLALYVALAPHGDAPIDEARLAELRQFRQQIESVAQSLDDSGFDAHQRERAGTILGRCGTFLDEVLKTGRFDPDALKTLTRSMGPLVLANAADAARAQIDAYHAQVSKWRSTIEPEEWDRLRVLVMGLQMPREHNLAVQYFAKLMGLRGESRRLVYAEELSGEEQALKLLATHQLDSDIAVAFFDDPDRMDIDLLGNAAAVYLDTLDLDR